MKKIMKKAITAIICAMLLVGTMGMTALAASGDIWGNLSGNWGTATLQNTSGNTRYCVITIRQYDYDPSKYTLVSSNQAVMSSGNTVTTRGEISDMHAIGVGLVYNSAQYQSGIGWRDTTQIK
ncbi:MAG: hypothetical protein HDT40_01665 [Lachnospiraceae bacterium]|nr:hypothetical protein [Lachnospiraceae bacterium]